jgi:L,D-transpeptidase-like protein
MPRLSLVLLALIALAPGLRAEGPSRVIISVKDQKLMLMGNGTRLATYPISTSKFGLGDDWGRMTTPLGFLQVAEKIGDHAPVGAVFRNRRFTGEILQPNAPGRDPVITRIIWLKGLEASNAHAFSRCIYIHGTPEEKTIGRPASYGCIRMKSHDVAELYAQLPIGALVEIVPDRLPKIPKAPQGAVFALQQLKPEPKAEPEAKAEPETVAEEPAAPVEKPVQKPSRTERKNLKQQPHFGRSA